ncbi:MAG TPA: Asp-tRNA(Asn)/Glu-tRNA(Gln) amidotransferase subunit GatC [Candidatus Nanopelagicales bacterium]|jgi:aspartyl-tRNA(Asn)/glutamyl-tRNA(Gln) amidotransferase subunit C|nr:Asp-tRNA(Asn)/Glu-tRNA(Gln) amidotransferase subunit GatC [Candidatus Nanopelagicales bacterium]
MPEDPPPTVAISRAEVAHLAALARLDLPEATLDHLAEQLQVILGAVASVGEVAAADVPATSHPLPLYNVFREDTVRASLTPEQVLAGAPAEQDDRFRVPRILDAE